jgi:hypothetical protein
VKLVRIARNAQRFSWEAAVTAASTGHDVMVFFFFFFVMEYIDDDG